jgi:hypothetical protein
MRALILVAGAALALAVSACGDENTNGNEPDNTMVVVNETETTATSPTSDQLNAVSTKQTKQSTKTIETFDPNNTSDK